MPSCSWMTDERPPFELNWACAWGPPCAQAQLKMFPEDFVVSENLGYDADGDGQHVLLWIEKRNSNTAWVAEELARFCGTASKAVGFAGMKDRWALTRQWFSVDLAGRDEPDWSAFNGDTYRLLAVRRHRRKLRRGALIGNDFTITLRAVEGDRQLIGERLSVIMEHGVPNYFGLQRFGHNGDNLIQASLLFKGDRHRIPRFQRGIYLSAARAYLFNRVLSQRVEQGNWSVAIRGDILTRRDARGALVVEQIRDEINTAVARGELIPSGPLWGRGRVVAQAEAGMIEKAVLAGCELLMGGLEQAGMRLERRSFRLQPQGMHWQWLDSATLRIHFTLPAGSYATMVIRELFGDAAYSSSCVIPAISGIDAR